MRRQRTPKELHKQVVTGIVQVIKVLNNSAGKSISFAQLSNESYPSKSELAQSYIFEFMKDGIVNLKPEQREQIVKGDYDWVWRMTNEYLEHFGYKPAQPVPIEV